MPENNKILYLTYDGLTDPLGQSQIIPYLKELSNQGYYFHVISFEKPDRYAQNKELIHQLIENKPITWHPLSFTKWPPLFSKIYDLKRFFQKAEEVYHLNSIKLLHCRSYVPALVAMKIKRKYGLKFIFDIRGLWVDERVEGGMWNLKNPIYKLIYKYFKSLEKTLFRKADVVLTLTHASKKYIDKHFEPKNGVKVVPCGTDLNRFKVLPEQQTTTLKKKLGYGEGEYILGYLGSVGTWYMLDEMFDLFKILLSKKKKARFLFITGDDPAVIFRAAVKKGITEDYVTIIKVQNHEVPAYLNILDLSVFFYKVSFSKIATSPTKHGELLGCHVPIICNQGIGDLEMIVKDSGTGCVIEQFYDDKYHKALKYVMNIDRKNQNFKKLVNRYYSGQKVVEVYKEAYESLI